VKKEDYLGKVKELKSKGALNPVITNKKKEKKDKIEDFFKVKPELNDFVKKKKRTKGRTK
jgi:UTP-glucose-1-phosphate uridylyltransferase